MDEVKRLTEGFNFARWRGDAEPAETLKIGVDPASEVPDAFVLAWYSKFGGFALPLPPRVIIPWRACICWQCDAEFDTHYGRRMHRYRVHGKGRRL